MVSYTLGIDVGGTFTDLVCIDGEGGVTIRKTPSTPADPSVGMMNAITKLANDLGKSREEFLPDVARICHGTTVTTNTVLTRSGALVGLLVTKGFRDMLRIRLRIRENMVNGISAVSVQRGEDPRGYILVAAGGAGPVHAASLARELGIEQILVPRASSTFCALGSVIADIRHDFVESHNERTDSADLLTLRDAFGAMERKGAELLEKEGVQKGDRTYQRSMDMKYKGQFHEVEVRCQG